MNEMSLPPGTRLLHIGPHKTGTTALQIALGKNRDALLGQGVRYVWGGEHLNANLAALAVAGRPTRRFASAKPVPMEHWTSLVAKVKAAKELERVVISGEEFCSVSETTILKIVEDLSRDRLQIVVTLRPLAKVIVSQWQQFVQAGSVTTPLAEWVDAVLSRDESVARVKVFWERHDHAALISRWSKFVGSQNMTVIVLDESDRGHLFRSFESLLGLNKGMLVADDRLVNRSLSWEEAESIRAMYVLLQEKNLGALSDHVRFMISPSELVKRERTPLASETKIEIPAELFERLRETSLEIVNAISSSGVRIIGSVGNLTPSHGSSSSLNHASLAKIPTELAGWTAYGVIVSSGIARGDLPPVPTSTLPFAWLRRATGSQLMREVVRRVKIRLSRPFSRLTGRNDEKAGR